MITPMKKLNLVVHKQVASKFIDTLQDRGVVHIVQEGFKSEEIQASVKIQAGLKSFLKSLPKDLLIKQEKYGGPVSELLDEYGAEGLKLEGVRSKITKFRKDYAELVPWGAFEPSRIAELQKESSVFIDFYRVSVKQFSKLDLRKVHFEVVNSKGPNIYFVTINRGESAPLPVEKLILPSIGVAACKIQIDHFEKEFAQIRKELNAFAAYKNQVSVELAKITDELSNRKAFLSLRDCYGVLASIRGWVPENQASEVEEFLNGYPDVVFIIEDPGEGDEIPILLTNSKFARLFEPITKLFALPDGMELDLTPFFAPFFAMFFGLCLGDAGYGFVLFFGALLAYFKFRPFRPIIVLGMILAGCTIFWGVLTGTTFGMNLFETKVPVLSGLAVLKSSHVFYLALMIGLVQIVFGMVLQTVNKVNRGGPLAGLSQIGWIFLVISLTALYLKGQEAPEGFVLGSAFIAFCKSIPPVVVYAGCIFGVGLILFFNDLRANIFVRFGKGLWELYGITGFAGDLLSYIRLFALGVSSAILGNVINSIGLQLLNIDVPVLSHILFLLFIIVGHGGNLLLASLGAFVHPLRLTFVEFYKNAGFSGGGKAYNPLRRVYDRAGGARS